MLTRPQLEAFLIWELADALTSKTGKNSRAIKKRILKTKCLHVFTSLVKGVKALEKIDYLISLREKDSLAKSCASIIDAQFLHFEGGKFFDTRGYQIEPKCHEKLKPRMMLFATTQTDEDRVSAGLLSAMQKINFKGTFVVVSHDEVPGLIKAATLLEVVQLRGECDDKKLIQLRNDLLI